MKIWEFTISIFFGDSTHKFIGKLDASFSHKKICTGLEGWGNSNSTFKLINGGGDGVSKALEQMVISIWAKLACLHDS